MEKFLKKTVPVLSLLFIIIFSFINQSSVSNIYADVTITRTNAVTNTRIYGTNSYSTSIAVADKIYDIKGKFKSVVVAYGGNFPDALSAGYLMEIQLLIMKT